VANEVRVIVKADTKNAQQDIEKFGNSLGGGLAGAARVGTAAVGGIGLAAAGGLAVSVNAAANFEHAISQVGAVANATKGEMQGLNSTALRIGKDTAFSATQAAGAMEILAANGVSVADIMNGAADASVALASAGGTDLATAADVASTSMAVWGLKAEEMDGVVNRLAGAANVSRFGVEDMAGAIAMGGGAAKLAGVDFGDFSTTIAAMAPSFSSGSDAGTSFKTFLQGLTPETTKAKDAFRALGLTAEDGSNRFFDAEGNLKSMAEVTDILHEATKDLTEEQKSQALTTIFGTDAMRAAGALSELTGEQFAAMNQTMKDTDATEVAATRMGNFKGSMEALKGSLETIQIEIGQKLLPKLTELADWAAEKLPVAFAYIETEIAPKVKAAFDQIAGAVSEFATAAAPHIARFGEEAKRQFQRFQGYYETDLKPAFDNIVKAVEYAVDYFKQHWGSIEPVVKGVTDMVRIQVEMIGNVLQIIIDLLSGDWKGAWENTKQLVQGAVDFWKTSIETGIRALVGLVTMAMDAGHRLMEAYRDGLAAVWSQWVWPFFQSIPGQIKSALGGAWEWMREIGANLVNGFFSGIKSTFDAGIGAVTDKLDPRNWDIPGLSPMPDAMEHAGQIGAKRFVGGLAGMIAADLPAAIAAATTVDWNRIYEDADVAALYNDVPDYVKRLSPAAGGSKGNAGPYHAAGPNGTVWDDAAGAWVYPWEVGSNLPQRIFDWQNSSSFGQTGQRVSVHIENVYARDEAEARTAVGNLAYGLAAAGLAS
jgi:TP901 family phage tail tape measure protein